jgi:hypothetical protein
LSCYEKNNKLLRNDKIIIIVREINTANLVNLNLKISPGTKEQRYCLRNKRILKHFKSTLAVFHVLSIMMVKCTLMKEQIKLKKKKKSKSVIIKVSLNLSCEPKLLHQLCKNFTCTIYLQMGG